MGCMEDKNPWQLSVGKKKKQKTIKTFLSFIMFRIGYIFRNLKNIIIRLVYYK